jgi:hypothetical protein
MSGRPGQQVLRVGISGHRDIATRYRTQEEALRRTLASVLVTFREAAPTCGLRIVSPLADGVDRLAAKIAFDLGYRLLAPLPFPQAEYERDFTAVGIADFRRLVGRAKDEDGVVELDGSRGDENAAYLSVGKYVIKNVDILIAVWDQMRPNLPAGTGDIVGRALERGLAVVWISPCAPEPAHLLVEPGSPPGPGSEIAMLLDGHFARKILDRPRAKR